MRRVNPLFALTLLVIAVAPVNARATASIGIPARAPRLIAAPTAASFSASFSELLTATARQGGPSTTTVGADLERRYGLALLDAPKLAASGVDLGRDWTLFDHEGSQYLGLWVKDRTKLTATLEAWAARRQLKWREERKVRKGLAVAFARKQGTRPACGYLVQGDRAVVLVQPGDREERMELALAALDASTPVRPGVEGALLVRWESTRFARETWIGVTASGAGLEIKASARDVVSGFLEPSTSPDGWIVALPTGSASEPVLRMRLSAGAKMKELLTHWSAKSADTSVTPGLVELIVPKMKRPQGRSSELVEMLMAMMPPSFIPTTGETGPVATDLPKCAAGHPVLSARWSPSASARSFDELSLIESLGDDLLTAVYGLHGEYGSFLMRMPPGVMVGCREGSRLTFTARWSLPR